MMSGVGCSSAGSTPVSDSVTSPNSVGTMWTCNDVNYGSSLAKLAGVKSFPSPDVLQITWNLSRRRMIPLLHCFLAHTQRGSAIFRRERSPTSFTESYSRPDWPSLAPINRLVRGDHPSG